MNLFEGKIMETIVQNLANTHPAVATGIGLVTATIAFASVLANYFPKATKFGKAVHFLAVNWSSLTGAK